MRDDQARGWLALAVCGLWIAFVSLCLGLVVAVWAATESKPLPALTLMTPPAPTSLLTITQPPHRSIVQAKATVTVIVDTTAFPGMTRLTVNVDGRPSGSSQQVCAKIDPPYECKWNVPAGANQTYTISAQAMDGTGKNTLTQIEVLAK